MRTASRRRVLSPAKQRELARELSNAAKRWVASLEHGGHEEAQALARLIVSIATSSDFETLPLNSPDRALIMQIKGAWNSDYAAKARHG